jgi:hypothetical protein
MYKTRTVIDPGAEHSQVAPFEAEENDPLLGVQGLDMIGDCW